MGHEDTASRYTLIKERTKAFCTAFIDPENNPPDKLISEHLTAHAPRITEYGPSWATQRLPFLGRTFTGREGFLEYFDVLDKTLEFLPTKNTFGSEESILVDERAVPEGSGAGKGGMSCVKGHAKFKAVATGKEWEEDFVMVLSEFDDDGKIGHVEIWGDTVSEWLGVVENEK